jgi:outer membrane protein assembly factor BamA
VAWDTRDDEVAPVRGVYLTEEVALTPGTFGDAWYRFARSTSAAHFYVPLIPRQRRLVFASRLVADFLVGNAPFYELTRYDDAFAIGGSKGVRGVPAQRYHGKIKLIANAELRTELLELRVFGTKRRLGLVAFADTGRLWADYAAHPRARWLWPRPCLRRGRRAAHRLRQDLPVTPRSGVVARCSQHEWLSARGARLLT